MSKLFDHAAHNGSNYLNGHCFVSLAIRNETLGRSRKVIADSPQGMLSPLKVDDNLYIETNFSTEALLKLLRDCILNRIDFDSRSITFEYWRP